MDCKLYFNLTNEMLDCAIDIAETLGKIDNKILERVPKLKEANLAKAVYSTLALKGNCLSYEQICSIGKGEQVLGAIKEIQEGKNAYKAYKDLPNTAWDSESSFLQSYKKLAGLSTKQYEQVHASLLEGVQQLLDWGRASSAHPLIKSVILHYQLINTQLPTNQSGKISRLWSRAVLTSWRPIFAFIPIESILLEQKEEYYKTLDWNKHKGSLNNVIMFMLQAILKAVSQFAIDIDNHLLNTSDRVRKLMLVAQEYPMSANELLGLLGLKSKSAFFKNYLQPALQAGLIAKTLPAKPTSGNQRYYKK